MNYKIVQQVIRKQKKMTGALRKVMVLFAIFFVVLGITISQGFMLPGFLLACLYFIYDIFSQREYEYILEDGRFEIYVILGRRYRKTAHVLEIKDMEVLAPNWHEKVAAYRKNAGGVRLPKYDYTSYEEDVPYYTMIIMENREKIKLLLDVNEEMLATLKRMYPDRVYLQ